MGNAFPKTVPVRPKHTPHVEDGCVVILEAYKKFFKASTEMWKESKIPVTTLAFWSLTTGLQDPLG